MNEDAAYGFGNLLGGRFCLDFVNTVGGRVGGPAGGRTEGIRDERLTSYEALLRWAALAGVLSSDERETLGQEAAARPAQAAAVLERALALREAVYGVFSAAIEGRAPRPDALAVLNRELGIARAHEWLVPASPFGWEWDDASGALDRVLWPVARSAAELLTSSDLERVGRCPGDACGWLFLDTSRSRRRRWCDMADCGNRAKVRRYRERQRTSG